jgi:hypothetical protein
LQFVPLPNMFEKAYSWGDQLALTLRALRTGYDAAVS